MKVDLNLRCVIVVSVASLVGCGRVPAASPSSSPSPVPETVRIERTVGRYSAECDVGPMDVVCGQGDLVSVELQTPQDVETVDLLGRVTLRDFVTGKEGARLVMHYQPPRASQDEQWQEPVDMSPGVVDVTSPDRETPMSTTLEWVAHDVPAGGITYIVELTVLPEISGDGGRVTIEMSTSDG